MKKRYVFTFVLMVMMLQLTGCSKKIELIDFVTVTYNGMNTKAVASTDFNFSVFEQAIGADENVSNLSSLLLLEDSIKVEISKDEELSNGDVVTVTVESANKEVQKALKLNLVDGKKEVKIEDLQEGSIIDIFKDVTVDFFEVSPYANARVLVDSDDAFIHSINYQLDKSTGLENGDVVTVTAEYSESKANDELYIIKEDTKEFVVEGIDEYVATYEEISDEKLGKINQQCLDVIDAKIADDATVARVFHPDDIIIFYDRGALNVESIEPSGAYYLVKKKGVNVYSGIENQLLKIYAIKFTDEKQTEEGVVYASLVFSNFINRDGVTDVKLTEARYNFGAYNNLDDLVRNCVTKYKDNYEIQTLSE